MENQYQQHSYLLSNTVHVHIAAVSLLKQGLRDLAMIICSRNYIVYTHISQYH